MTALENTTNRTKTFLEGVLDILKLLREIIRTVQETPAIKLLIYGGLILVSLVVALYVLLFFIGNNIYSAPIKSAQNWAVLMQDKSQRTKVWELFTPERQQARGGKVEVWLKSYDAWQGFKVVDMSYLENDGCQSSLNIMAVFNIGKLIECANLRSHDVQMVYQVTERFSPQVKGENAFWLELFNINRRIRINDKDQFVPREFTEVFSFEKLGENWLISKVKRQEVSLIMQ